MATEAHGPSEARQSAVAHLAYRRRDLWTAPQRLPHGNAAKNVAQGDVFGFVGQSAIRSAARSLRVSNEKISTKEQVAFLDSLGVASSALYVTDSPTPELLLSIRNLPDVTLSTPSTLSVRDVVVFDHLILDADAVAACESLWGQS